MTRLYVLTVMSALLFAGQVFAQPFITDRGIVRTSGRADISDVPANQLSNLYNFMSGHAPDFMNAMSEANRKANLPKRKRHAMASTCRKDMMAIVNQRAPAQIQVKPLPEILEATNKLGISEDSVRYTLAAYQSHESVIRNNRYITIVEYGRNSNRPRLFIIDLVTAQIRKYNVAHGSRSGSSRAPATSFGNTDGSKKSSIGCALTGGFYGGKHGTSMRFHGLEVGKNDNMCVRSVVMHSARARSGADYAVSGGTSWGCPAVSPDERNEVFGQIKGGSMYCAFGDRKDNHQLAQDERPQQRRQKSSRRKRG